MEWQVNGGVGQVLGVSQRGSRDGEGCRDDGEDVIIAVIVEAEGGGECRGGDEASGCSRGGGGEGVVGPECRGGEGVEVVVKVVESVEVVVKLVVVAVEAVVKV